MNNGWIKLHRSLLDWEWYDDANVVRLFLHCTLRANHTEKQWRGITISRGQFYTSLDTLVAETGLSTSQLRTCFKKLESTGEVTSSSQARGRMVTVKNYDQYQQDDRLMTGSSQADDRVVTANKNDKKEKNEKNEKKTYYTEAEGLVIPQDFLDKMIQTYLRINVANQIKGMEGWLLANPKKRKKNYESFINNWLSRADKDAPSAGGQPILF